ncbi:hypothetical protein RhiirA1_455444 [Rhizophagus irregularis]|uniref:Uncharacterized protein n=1 Tax=Rhizophagus irregularis TaxID=588596 RepID=A0A2I1F6Y4_9GLOM|nr:hypothetical protein RhiirA1_455444 [Rhizophagus irregularis]PKY30135.1 hypothetical protein RhiirB3_447072 [Rhizophagus irregularis]
MANFNAQDSNTSFAHSKDTAWKIKTSINTLPTLDILNRNFPDLIQNKTTCLMSTFTQLASDADNIIRKEADKLSLCITDSIKYSDTLIGFIRIFLLRRPKSTYDFLSIAQSLIKSNIWKHRSTSWKQWKLSNDRRVPYNDPIPQGQEDFRPRSNIQTRSRHNFPVNVAHYRCKGSTSEEAKELEKRPQTKCG